MPGESDTLFSGLRVEDRPKLSKPIAGPDPPAVRAVAKGAENINVLNFDPPREYFAFLYQNETSGPEGPWILRFEAIEAEYFRVLWKELRAAGGERLEILLQDALQGGRFYQAFAGLTSEAKHLAYTWHMRFMLRLLNDPGPVSLIEAMLSPQHTALEDLVEGDWFLLRCGPPTALVPLRNPQESGEVLYADIALTPDEDGKPTLHRLQFFEPMGRHDPPLNNILQALHFPQGDPNAVNRKDALSGANHPPDSRRVAGWLEDDGTIIITGARGEIKITPGSGAAFTPRTVANGGDAKRQRLDPAGAVPPGGGGGAAAPLPIPAAPLPVPAAPLPVPAAPLPVAPNLMQPVPFGVQPLVGVNSVGAGNNVALWSSNGIVLAYHDFGFPTAFNIDTYPGLTDTCVCDDPIMILSHWDYDHFAMVRWETEALRRRWVVPQQPFGSVASREIYIRILREVPAGSMELWPLLPGGGPVLGYISTPFGYLERATGPPVNDDGLVLYVRVAGPGGAFAPPPALFVGPPRGVPIPGVIPPGALLRRSWIVGNTPGPRQNDEDIDIAIPPPYNNNMIVIPAVPGTPLAPPAPGAPPAVPPPGMVVPAGMTALPIGGGAFVLARWVPAAGIPLPGGLGNYRPPAPVAGPPIIGGWALMPQDYVRMGGFIIDIPSTNTVAPHYRNCVLSPTPGSAWVPPGPPPAGPAVLIGPGGIPQVGGRPNWLPVWGNLGPFYEVVLPPGALAAAVPLPAGPNLLVPVAAPAPFAAGDSYVLLPGDAGTRFIPSQNPGPAPAVVSFVATHHGSESWMLAPAAANFIPAVPPLVAGQDKIVYSYGVRHPGLGHCYVNAAGFGHPRPAAIATYVASGWGTPVAPLPAAPLPAGPPIPAIAPPVFHRLNTPWSDLYSLPIGQASNPLALPAAIANPRLIYHRNGDVAIGWDAVVGGPINPVVAPPPAVGVRPPINRTCGICGLASNHDFCF